MGSTHSRRLRAFALTTAATTVSAMLALLAPVAAHADSKPASSSTPTTVSSDSLSTAQLANGVGWGQAVIGSTVYVGGSFTGALAPGATTGSSSRSNLMSYNLTTGALNSFAPTVNGVVQAVAAAPDGSALYIGGNFTSVNGTTRNRIAALNPTTGAVLSWNPNVNGQVNAIEVTSNTVYFGGQFTTVGGTTRTRAAAVSISGTGALTTWAPTNIDNAVKTLAVNTAVGKVAVGGFFQNIDNGTGVGFGVVDATNGTTLYDTPVRSIVNDGSTNSAIYGLSSDGSNVYASGYYSQQDVNRTGNLEGTFSVNWSTGATTWLEDCHGDEYDSVPMNGALYVVGHPHYCDDVPGGYEEQHIPGSTSPQYYRAVAFTTAASGQKLKTNTILQPRYYDYSTQTAPTMLAWYPTLAAGSFTGSSQAAYNLITSGNYLLMTGEFPRVNGGTQYGIARFAAPTTAPNTDGPQLSGSTFPIYGSTINGGSAKISWLANYDRDNENLTYTLYRNNTLIYTTTAASRMAFQRPTLSYTDTGVTAGTAYSYKVTATDPWGNAKTSSTLSFTPSATSVSSYAKQVVADGATDYYRLGESSGTTSADTAGGNPATSYGGVTRGASGAISGDSNGATTFDGASGTTISSNVPTSFTDNFSVEAWFKTTATVGGEIVGGGDAQQVTTTTFTPPGGQPMTRTGDSGTHDREISTTADGHVTFVVQPGNPVTLTSSKGGYNDGKWHHVVGTLGSTGMALYVDGQSAATGATTRAVGVMEYVRIGGDSGPQAAPDPNAPPGPPAATPNYFTGSIDEAAVYIGKALTSSQVANHYSLGGGGGTTTNNPPTASFTQSASGLTVSTDGSASSDSDGTIASYSWNWGDGTTTTGQTSQHTYASAGTKSVTLTVTDDDGDTGTNTQSISVSATNSAPTAAYTSSSSGLALSVDGTTSTDSDGTIASYAWDFGDHGTATTATATHTYAAAGTYSVKLTVTDNDSATNSVTKSIVITAGTTTTIAQDSFTRTTSAGSLGSADTGGSYTLSGTTSYYSVNGSTAQVSTTAGSTKKALLNSTSSSDTDITATVKLSALSVGGSTYGELIGRSISGDDYRARVVIGASGSVQIIAAHGMTSLRSATVSGLTYNAGDTLQIRLQVYGTSPTTIRARVWKTTATEPTTWQVTTTDSTSALQAAGSVGFATYLGSGATNGPITVSIDDLLAVPTGN